MAAVTEATEEFYRELDLLRTTGLKDNRLRLEYEQKVRDLEALKQELAASGCSAQEMAKTLHTERRRLGEVYKYAAPPLFRQYILYATEKKYGDPLGPDYERLRQRKSDEEIIESASRPIRDLSDRLTVDGFIAWFRDVYSKTGPEAVMISENV